MKEEKHPVPIPGTAAFDRAEARTTSRDWRRFTRRTLGILGIGVSAMTGAVVATHVSPADGEFFGITSHESFTPFHPNQISAPTSIGDVSAEFSHGLLTAPGITIDTEVTPEAVNNIDVFQNMATTPKAYERAAESYAKQQFTELAETSAIGGVIGGAAALGMMGLASALRKERDGRSKKYVSGLVLAGVVGAGAVPASSVAMYGNVPHNFDKLSFTGFLAQAKDVPSSLKLVSRRQVEETKPYLQGILALGKLADQKLGTSETDGKAVGEGPKLLLISDVHGVNDTAILKKVIREQGIDAVIDTGDETNFGRPAELEAINLVEGIESLGVPYFWVRGNHDGSHENDNSVTRYLEQAPNFHALQPNENQFDLYTFDGLAIGGMNDLRFYGDDETKHYAGLEKQYAEAFNRTMDQAGAGPLDIVMSHEPAAGRNMDGLLKLYGHTHEFKFNGKNEINIGTLTGGDPIRGVLDWEKAQQQLQACEMDGKNVTNCFNPKRQPSFSVVSYDSECNPTSLVTYDWYIADGRLYKSKGVAYPLRLQAEGDDRSCEPDGSLSVRHVKVSDFAHPPLPTVPAAPTVNPTLPPSPTTATKK